jgi:hypothetical protein
VCHNSLLNASFYDFLKHIDEDLLAETRARGCQRCHGVLHKGRYPRKPRGGPAGLCPFRLSLTCSKCNKRHTPASVRWLGHKVYLGAIVVLASALRTGLTDQRAAHLIECIKVPKRTIERWRSWWLRDFAGSAFWKEARARFMPPVAVGALPTSLLERFSGPDLSSQLVAMLRFLTPLSEGGGSATYDPAEHAHRIK